MRNSQTSWAITAAVLPFNGTTTSTISIGLKHKKSPKVPWDAVSHWISSPFGRRLLDQHLHQALQVEPFRALDRNLLADLGQFGLDASRSGISMHAHLKRSHGKEIKREILGEAQSSYYDPSEQVAGFCLADEGGEFQFGYIMI